MMTKELKMKKYLVTYEPMAFGNFLNIGVKTKVVFAETKAKARKKFNDSFYQPYPIINIELIKGDEV